jgi:cytochrome c peroxidase
VIALVLLACASGPVSIEPTTPSAPTETAVEPRETEHETEGPHETAETGAPTPAPTPWAWELPSTVLPPVVPESNPMTVEKVELGRHLFYDPRLSGDGRVACASCHQQEYGFAVPEPVSSGVGGAVGVRNAQHLANTAWNATYTWMDPTIRTLEDQIVIPMFGEDPLEMGVTGNEDVVLLRLAADPAYAVLFERAFPGVAWGMPEIVQALASFVRSLVSFGSPYDRYLQGEAALSDSELRGMNVFFSELAQCHHCHNTFLLSDSAISTGTTFFEYPMLNTGLYNVGGTGAYPPESVGAYAFTKDEADIGAFRPPSLRNVAVTGPYAHDGSVATLEEVVDIYIRGGRLVESGPYAGDGALNPYKSDFVSGFTLSAEERDDLLAFLRALTDEQLLTNPAYADPW